MPKKKSKKSAKPIIKKSSAHWITAHWITFLIIFIIIIITAIAFKQNAVEKGVAKILELDAKYNASLYKEALDVENKYSREGSYYYPFDWDRVIVALDNIAPMLSGLQNLKTEFNKLPEGKEKESLLLLTNARIKMLESEKYYQLAQSMGPKGELHRAIYCQNKQHILTATELYNISVITGKEARKLLDKAFTVNAPTAAAVGLPSKRPKFYDSPFYPIMEERQWYNKVIGGACN